MSDFKTAIIIGAGPASLTAAYELLGKTEIKPIVFELTADIEGVSKTVILLLIKKKDFSIKSSINDVTTKDNIWQVNSEEEYHETKITAVENLTEAHTVERK